MTRINHRGWHVLLSVEADDGALCVDFFGHVDEGGFGFEHFRSDPEDRGGWTAIGGFSSTRYQSMSVLFDAAHLAVPWLTTHPKAAATLAEWRDG